jgi:hypothetical protein
MEMRKFVFTMFVVYKICDEMKTFHIPECPITGESVVDPVTSPRGHTYSRRAIVEWLHHNQISPMTRQPLTINQLVPNFALREVIEENASQSTTTTTSSSSSSSSSTSSSIYPLTTVVELDKMWGEKSALLRSTSLLAKWKMEFLRLLEERKFIAFERDNRNATPHICLGQTLFTELDGRQIVLCLPAINISNNHVEVNTGTKTHLTMVYAKNIGNKRRETLEALRDSLTNVAVGRMEQ